MLPTTELANETMHAWHDLLEAAAIAIVEAGHEPEKCVRAYGPGSTLTIYVNGRSPTAGEKIDGVALWTQRIESGVADGKVWLKVVGEWLCEKAADGSPIIPKPLGA